MVSYEKWVGLLDYTPPAMQELRLNGYLCSCTPREWMGPNPHPAGKLEGWTLTTQFVIEKPVGRHAIGSPQYQRRVWRQRPRKDGVCPYVRTVAKLDAAWQAMLVSARSAEEYWVRLEDTHEQA